MFVKSSSSKHLNKNTKSSNKPIICSPFMQIVIASLNFTVELQSLVHEPYS